MKLTPTQLLPLGLMAKLLSYRYPCYLNIQIIRSNALRLGR
jgi:hypothetical protein